MIVNSKNFENFTDFSSPNKLILALKEKSIAEKVDDLVNNSGTINIEESMHQLTTVSPLLQFAYAASIGFNCNAPILKLISKYQDIIKSTYVFSHSFLTSSLKALEQHAFAIEMLNENEPQEARNAVSQCATIAEKMAKGSRDLADLINTAVVLATEALELAGQDQTLTITERNKIRDLKIDCLVNEKKHEMLKQDLEEQVKESKEREEKLYEKLDQELKRKHDLAIIGAVMNGVGQIGGIVTSVLGKGSGGDIQPSINENTNTTFQNSENSNEEKLKDESTNIELELTRKKLELEEAKKNQNEEKQLQFIENLEKEILNLDKNLNEKKEKLKQLLSKITSQSNTSDSSGIDILSELGKNASKDRSKKEKYLRESKSELVKLKEQVMFLKTKDSSLGTAIESLGIAIKTMGRVKTIFSNVELFWRGMVEKCEEMKDEKWVQRFDIFIKKGDDSQAKAKEIISAQAYQWMCVGVLGYRAYNGMHEVNNSIDKVMSNLPSKKEAKSLMEKFDPSLLEQKKIKSVSVLELEFK